ncbi:MAG: DUF1302 family protein [Candidatus Marinimicrobia bacterium]|nr:DUF1302 family protein [Candidatus Neomarinimicrobiota bacterium]
MKYKIVTLLFLLAGIGTLNAQIIHRGFVRTHLGGLIENGEYSVLKNTFDWRLEYSKGDVGLFVNTVFDHNGLTKDLDINLRQAYFDIYFDNFDLRIGKQQIIWGKAQGVFITDIVSPKNLSDFLLPDFEEIRIGITSVKVDYYMGNNTLELVWVPLFSPTIMPNQNSIWYPKMDFPIIPTFDYSKKEIDANLDNGEYFIKYSLLSSKIDFELMSGYMWDDDPTMHVYKTINPQTMQIDSLAVVPQHHRLGLGGASFSTTVGRFILRGEGAFYDGKYFNTEDPQIADAVIEKDYLHYLVGLDFSLFGINMSTQFIQQAILDYNDQIKNDEYENTMTYMAYKTFLRETLKFEFFSYIGFNSNDALIRPKISYDLSDGFEVIFGANIFVGDEGKFGNYDDNDMLYAKIKYSF